MKMRSFRLRFVGVVGLMACTFVYVLASRAERPASGGVATSDALENEYEKEIRPVFKQFCHRCHSAKRTEADVNLEAIVGRSDVRKALATWEKVHEMLAGRQMPPKKARQPSDAERSRLLSWVNRYLQAEANARAGDPGPVVLRRLSNAEYTYTIRDLTGVPTLDPAREFPVDGAAGEGFTNTGNALVMSPTLLGKYLDAAKDIAGHAVLLPDGIRFSPHTTRRDWTNEALERIRAFYRQYSELGASNKVRLQGLVWDANEGGHLAVQRYLRATLAGRAALNAGQKSIEALAHEHGVNAKYLGLLWKALNGKEPSPLLDGLRTRWREARPEQAAELADEIARWQAALWRFNSVGHIGKVGGPKVWQEPVAPMVSREEIRFKIPAKPSGAEVTFYLTASDIGGTGDARVVWERPRLVAAGRPDLPLRDVRDACNRWIARRQHMFDKTATYLAAAAEAESMTGKISVADLAKRHDLDTEALTAWLDYLGIGTDGPIKIDGHFTQRITEAGGYKFITGWGSNETPLIVANSSDEHVRIPGKMKPHGVAVHPSPTLQAVIGWQSPVSAGLRVKGKVVHAHPECGNGVTWTLELRRGVTRRKLAGGFAQGAREVKIGPIEGVVVKPGDVVALLVGPRNGSHACGLTAVDLVLGVPDHPERSWDLARDVSADILVGNPHADRFGYPGVWHFFTEAVTSGNDQASAIPPGSLVARWQAASSKEERQKLAGEVQHLLSGTTPAAGTPDAALYRELTSLGGPLFARRRPGGDRPRDGACPEKTTESWGLDPVLFGPRPDGGRIDPYSLSERAPSIIEVRLPADLPAGCELVVTGVLDQTSSSGASVQLQVLDSKPAASTAIQPDRPILAKEGSAAARHIKASFDEFRRLFPVAVCYSRIVPVDEVITLTLFYREDEPLCRLMLDEDQKKYLDRLWDELRFVSQDALTMVDAFAQLLEYASQDSDPRLFEPMRKPIQERAAAFRKLLVASEPRHLDGVLDFAGRAYRRPLSKTEISELRTLYQSLRAQKLPHEKAIRLVLARVLVAPSFLYRLEKTHAGIASAPVSDWELAGRLSYFLWSSQPDDELRQLAATGRLADPDMLASQTRRMLRDERVRRLAAEFGCQWLHVRDFDQLNEKSERHFPSFAGLRDAMHEESLQFFTDLFRSNRSVLDILGADYTFLNEALARHYEIPGVRGSEWRRVDGVKQYARGGVLGQATVLASQSGASRTSPILRGNWVSEVLLGEKLPRPPKEVPRLPDEETATEGLTVRQLVEKHTIDPKCAVCHRRIDAYGFALEEFDAIGRRRDKDLGNRLIDTHAQTVDGSKFEGIEGLRNYLLSRGRAAFVRQFCRKLLGYALGRAVQLSDEPLLEEMGKQLEANDYRVQVAVETIVRSRQFREIRGREGNENE